MTSSTAATTNGSSSGPGSTQPHVREPSGIELQRFDQMRNLPIGLDVEARREVCQGLNAILADSRILHDLYKKHHWLMRGHTFYQLHLLLDTHAEQQDALIDKIAERIQTLGAVAVGDPRHVAELTRIPRAPDGVEDVSSMLNRLLRAHEIVIVSSRKHAEKAAELGDTGTEDLLASEVLPKNELQSWFLVEHLVEVPLIDP
jgi:starvation-inducible DNA-binding protein